MKLYFKIENIRNFAKGEGFFFQKLKECRRGVVIITVLQATDNFSLRRAGLGALQASSIFYSRKFADRPSKEF